MKTFLVLWTYIGNYAERATEVQAKDPVDATARLIDSMYPNPEFRAKATFHVWGQMDGGYTRVRWVNDEPQVSEATYKVR